MGQPDLMAGADFGGFPAEPQGLDLLLDRLDAVFGDVGDQQVLPDRQPDRRADEVEGLSALACFQRLASKAHRRVLPGSP